MNGNMETVCNIYKLMRMLFMKGEDDEYIFAHAFLGYKWNLRTWAKNIEDRNEYKISWVEDALGLHFPKSKTNLKRSDEIKISTHLASIH